MGHNNIFDQFNKTPLIHHECHLRGHMFRLMVIGTEHVIRYWNHGEFAGTTEMAARMPGNLIVRDSEILGVFLAPIYGGKAGYLVAAEDYPGQWTLGFPGLPGYRAGK